MGRYYYEDGRWPWRADGILRRYLRKQRRQRNKRGRPAYAKASLAAARDKPAGRSRARALDLGMGYGRNAVWLARLRQGYGGQARLHPGGSPQKSAGQVGGQAYAVEGWELDRRYLAEAKREAHRYGVKLTCRRVDFTRARFRGPYEVIVISLALHQVPRSAGLRVLGRAKAALAPGGQLFLMVKLTRDRHFQRVQGTPGWKKVPGEKNTFFRPPTPGRRYFHPGRRRLRHRILSALTPGEVKGALRGLRIRHWREQVLRSDWEEPEPACPELVERVTHQVAEVVAERMRQKRQRKQRKQRKQTREER